MYSIERQSEIISLLEHNDEVIVNDLALRFDVSKETIRRDLSELEKTGVLVRTHGGAVGNQMDNGQKRFGGEYPVNVRSIRQFKEKSLICKYAARFIGDGDVLFLDNSSTTLYLLQHIPSQYHITVVTNSLRLLHEASILGNTNIQYYSLGGIFKLSNLSCYGTSTQEQARKYFPSVSFLSCAGIRGDGMLTDTSMEESEAKQMMIQQSTRVVLLADHTKFSTSGQVYLAHLSEKFTLVTDEQAKDTDFSEMKKTGAEILLV